jgi:phosphatidylglycerol---prolipoprotein diacylglyceryl transferase
MTFEPLGIHFVFHLFGLPIDFILRYYGIILVTGAFLGGYLASLEAGRRGHNPDLVWDGLIWALVAGIVGARVWHILTPPPSMQQAGYTTAYYLTHLFSAIDIRNGGLGLPGAVAGGLLGMFLYTRYMRLNFVEWTDIVAPAIPLGQAIGRWGNYVNQELYGGPTRFPWGITIDALPGQKYHPAFLYESIGNLCICLAILYIGRRYKDWLKTGDLFLFYLIFYPILRFFMEFIRLDSSQVFGLNANQTLMVILMAVSAAVLAARHRRVRRYQMKAQAPQ